jgi:PST family polysaccharide transporter
MEPSSTAPTIEDSSEFRESMGSLPATLVVGAGAVVTLALSVVTLKVYALVLGPEGVGVLALLQALLNIAAIVFSFGLNVTVIGELARADREGSASRSVLEGTAVLLATIGALIAVVVISLVSGIVAETIFESHVDTAEIVLVGFAASLTIPAWVLLAIQNARHRIRVVTAANVGTAMAAAAIGVAMAVAFGRGALAPILLITALAQLLIALTAVRLFDGGFSRQITFKLGSAAHVLRRSLPVVGSQMAGVGTAFLIPVLVLNFAGIPAVGLYRAAAAVSVGYLAFFLASLTQDYLPRIAAASDDNQLSDLLERRMRIVIGIGGPLIVALLALGPRLLSALYSPAFEPANVILQWALVGDLLRLPASVLSLVLLGKGATSRYVMYEVASAVTVLAGTVIGLKVAGLAGIGIGYAAAQVANYALVWTIVRRYAPATPGRLQVVVMALTAFTAGFLWIGVSDTARLAVFGTVAVSLALVAWPRLARMHGRGAL